MQHDQHVIAWIVHQLMDTRTPPKYRKALNELDEGIHYTNPWQWLTG